MRQISLNGMWRLKYYDKNNRLGNIYSMDYNDKSFLDARVPGDVHLDLIRAGIIDEPLYDRNVNKCRWMENKKWLYRKKFNVPAGFKKDRAELIFEGLDTVADIWLNGRKIGYHKNAHVGYRIDVTDKVRVGKNILVVNLGCGLELARGKPMKKYGVSWYHPFSNERIWIRKPQFAFKWDWAPRLITCGIWRPVSLVSYEKISLRNVFVYSKLIKNSADVFIKCEIENFLKKNLKINMGMFLKDSSKKYAKAQKIVLKPGINKISTKLYISSPELWWPRPLGKPNLYDFKIEVTENNHLLDEYKTRVGIREVKLLQEPLPEPEGGKCFTFVINNKKVFCNGANWVPADSIIARVSKEKYRKLIELAVDANFNMFRIWGGGIYEDEYFYQLCDEHGIMIWQDFLYACALYPDDDLEFCREIEIESIKAVRRLRNHTCLVCWCGNNENDWLWHPTINWLYKISKIFYGKKIYHKILPKVCRNYDPSRPYWPSSPYGGKHPNSAQEGDYHCYFHANYGGGFVDGTDHKMYGKLSAKFLSEYNSIGSISKRSLKKCVPQSELSLKSKSLLFHVNSLESLIRAFKRRIKLYCKRDVDSIPLDEFIILTQFIQGERLKYAIEHCRRRKFFCSGTLFWKYSDAWPEMGDTIVDYYLDLKPSYYYVKRVYEPVHITVKDEEYGVSVWLVNDTLDEFRGEIECRLQEFTGKIIKTSKEYVRLKPNSSQVVFHDRMEPFGKTCFYYVRFTCRNKVMSENRHFFAKFKELRLQKVNLKHSLKKTRKSNEYLLNVKSDNYALMVQLDLPQDIKCDNNYFDILPGETKKVRLIGKYELLKKIKIHAMNEILGK